MIVEFWRVRKWRRPLVLHPPHHDCWFFRLGPFRARIGDGRWLVGDDVVAINRAIDLEANP